MACLIVTTRHLRTCSRVVAIVYTIIELTAVAIPVVGDIRVHIRLIVAQINRCRLMIVVRVIIPIIRRTPWMIMRHSPTGKHGRSTHKNGANIVVGAVDIRCTDDLHIRSGITHLCRQGGYVLENVLRQHCLDNHHVIVAVYSLHNTQIINISIAIQVQRRKHVSGRVEQHLKLLKRVSRSKCRAHCTQVEEETDVFTQRRYVDHSRSGMGRRGFDDSGSLGRLYVRTAIDHAGCRLGIYDGSARYGSLCRSDNACNTTAQKQRCTTKNKTNFFHI